MFKQLDRSQAFSHPLQSGGEAAVAAISSEVIGNVLLDIVSRPVINLLPPTDYVALFAAYEPLQLLDIQRRVDESNAQVSQAWQVVHREPTEHERMMQEIGRNMAQFFPRGLDRDPEIVRRYSRQNWPVPSNPEFETWWASHAAQSRYQAICTEAGVQPVASNALVVAAASIEPEAEFFCPISGEIMRLPAFDSRSPQQPRCDFWVLVTWLEMKGTNPFDRSPLAEDNLACDSDLKQRIDDFVARSPSHEASFGSGQG